MPSLTEYAFHAKYDMRKVARDFKPEGDSGKLLRDYKTFCLALKVLAFHELLAECHPDGFFRYLYAAAVNWKVLLERVHARPGGYRVPAFLNEPFLGALICGQVTLARELADLSARERTPPEYDDEFCAALFFQEFIRSRVAPYASGVDLLAICEQIDAYLGASTPRVEAFRMLARGDEAIWPAFEAWAEYAAREAMTKAEAPGAPYFSGITRSIWLEGLAVLRMARLAGLKVPDTHFRLMPRLVHIPPAAMADVSMLRLDGMSLSGRQP